MEEKSGMTERIGRSECRDHYTEYFYLAEQETQSTSEWSRSYEGKQQSI